MSVKKHDVIQVLPTHHWANCLLYVDDVRSWGVIAYHVAPLGIGPAYIRIEHKDYVVIGAGYVSA